MKKVSVSYVSYDENNNKKKDSDLKSFKKISIENLKASNTLVLIDNITSVFFFFFFWVAVKKTIFKYQSILWLFFIILYCTK